MSTVRRQQARRLRNPEGITICSCGCGQIPKPPRQTWFSQACVDAWLERNDPGHIRKLLLKRDRGICAVCGIDCTVLQHDVQHAKTVLRCSPPDSGSRKFRRGGSWNQPFLRDKYNRCLAIWQRWKFKRIQAARNRLDRLKQQGWDMHRKTFFDADHIVPVVEGGGQCDLTGYRLLCQICHKQASRELAARRAQQRKLDKQRGTS